MKPREKLLAIVVGAFVALFLLNTGYQQISSAFERRQVKIDEFKKKVADKELTLRKGANATRRIAEWQKISLPSDPELARPLYHQWLLELVDGVDLNSAVVNSPATLVKNAAYEKFDFSVKAECDVSLKQLVDFLYEFYSVNQLHRIRQLSLKPKQDGKLLDVTIDIEALVIPGADRKDKLNKEPANKLLLADLAAYQKLIGERNLFAEYTPPVARREVAKTEPVKQAFDVVKYATVTGIIEDNSRPQLWVRVKTTDQMLKLSEGDEFTVGDVQCKVVSIGVREAIVNVGGKRKQVHLADNLRDAIELPAEEL
jgi:hypothetical protein